MIGLYILGYPDTNISHFKEIISEDLDCDLSCETIRLWLQEEKILSPRAHRKTRKELRKRLQEELKEKKLPKEEKNELRKRIETLDKRSVNPRRVRVKFFGGWYRWMPRNITGSK